MTRKKKMGRTDMQTYLQILRLKFEARLSDRQIAQALNIGRATISALVARFNNLGLSWPLSADYSLDALDKQLFPGRDYKSQRVLPSWVQVHLELRQKGVTKLLLWQEYQAEHGARALGYTQFCEHYRRWRAIQKRSMRQHHEAGDKLFIDFCGPTVPIVNPKTGEIRWAAIFVATLGASNYTYIEACKGQDMESWLMANSRCLTFLGGVPALLIPDNLKAAVDKADRYEPIINDNYKALARHYGCALMPTRPRKPQDKGKVESAVLIVERWVLARLRHHIFYSLAALNQAIRELNIELNQRPMKQYNGASREQLFTLLDKPALQPLPPYAYEYTDYRIAKVAKDYHVQYDNHWYSVPHRLVGERVEISATQTMIKVYHQTKCVSQHPRSHNSYRHSTDVAHMPENHAAYQEWSPERIRRWATAIGPNTLATVLAVERSKTHIVQAQRSCLALLSEQKRYGSERLESACTLALSRHQPYIPVIKKLLRSGEDLRFGHDDSNANDPGLHANIRGSHYYQ
ncbi:IS21 family transposase [Maribrevibacterium harenarium]